MTAVQERAPAAAQPIRRGSSLNLVGSLTLAGSNVLLLAIVTRALGAGGAGAFLEAVALVTISLTLATLGADTGLIRALARPSVRTTDQVRRTLVVALVPVLLIGSLIAAVLWIAAPAIAGAVGDEEHIRDLTSHVRTMAPFIPLGALMLALLGATRGLHTMTPTVVLDRVLRPALQISGCSLVIVLGAGAATLGLAWAAPYAVSLLLAVWWCARLVARRGITPITDRDPAPASPDRRREAVEFWSFTAPRALAAGMQILMQWVDVLLVGAFLSTRDAGIYAVASRVIQLGFYVVYAVGQAVQPRLARLFAAGEREGLQGVFRRATVWTTMIVWPVFLAGAVAAPVLLRVFGPEFVGGAAAVAILALSGLVSSGVGPVDMVLLMAGRSSANLGITAVALVSNVALNLLLIPRFGITGAASAWAASRIIAKLLSLRHVMRHVHVHPFGPDVLRVAAIAGLCYGMVGLLVRTMGLDAMIVVAYLTAATTLYALLLHDRIGEVRHAVTRAPPLSTET